MFNTYNNFHCLQYLLLFSEQIRWYFVEVTQADEELMEYDVRTSYRIEKAYRSVKYICYILL